MHQTQHGRCGAERRNEGRANLGVTAALEEARDTDEADVVVPHHRVRLAVCISLHLLSSFSRARRGGRGVGQAEGVLEHLEALSACLLPERLLLRVVGDVSRVLTDPLLAPYERLDVPSAQLTEQVGGEEGEVLLRRVVDGTFGSGCYGRGWRGGGV